MPNLFEDVEVDDDQIAYTNQVKDTMQDCYDKVMNLLPEGREANLFTDRFQEAGLWAERSIKAHDIA